ncbi:MAG TPA: GvpL/GvpF family gas vesicle protein [Chloroflexota bacterium]|nr:GvpL/GvpF family gas vesicle protein [Chloroflexota bacterium]
MSAFLYLYCLLPADTPADVVGITGIDGRAVRLERVAGFTAAVSEVGEDFAEGTLNERIRDLDWLSPRAVQHHEVVDALYTQTKHVLPLSFGAIFRDPASLAERLTQQRRQLAATLEDLCGKEEWNLKLVRDEGVFFPALREHSPELRSLTAAVSTEAPGKAFMLRKKQQAAEGGEARRVTAEVRERVFKELAAYAAKTHRDALVAPAEGSDVRLELRASYLVQETAAVGLKNASERLSIEYAPLGFRLELTGPWPPFTFAGSLA